MHRTDQVFRARLEIPARQRHGSVLDRRTLTFLLRRSRHSRICSMCGNGLVEFRDVLLDFGERGFAQPCNLSGGSVGRSPKRTPSNTALRR